MKMPDPSKCRGVQVSFAADYVSGTEERVHQSGAVHHLLSRRPRGVSVSAGKGVTVTLAAVAAPGETIRACSMSSVSRAVHGWMSRVGLMSERQTGTGQEVVRRARNVP